MGKKAVSKGTERKWKKAEDVWSVNVQYVIAVNKTMKWGKVEYCVGGMGTFFFLSYTSVCRSSLSIGVFIY